MLGGIGAKIAGLDESVRRSMAERAYQARTQQIDAVRTDLRQRMQGQSPDVGSVGAAIADRLGGSADDYLKALKSRAAGAQGKREALYQQAAVAERPGVQVRLNDLLSGTDLASRSTQAGVYGAIGGGAVAGLTAAGQGLMALMDYLQQGNQVAADRDDPEKTLA